MSEEREKEIMEIISDRYSGMTLSELDDALRGKKPDGLTSKIEFKAFDKPAIHDGMHTNFYHLDEAGHRDTSKIEKHWVINPDKLNFHKPIKSKTMEGKTQGVKHASEPVRAESEATSILNRLCNIEDIALANRNRSKSIRESVFGLTPPDDPIDKLNEKSECWFAIVNDKLDQILGHLHETSEQLERTYQGMQF